MSIQVLVHYFTERRTGGLYSAAWQETRDPPVGMTIGLPKPSLESFCVSPV